MKKVFSKGKANQESLADRMKKYEAITTEVNLIEKLPIYARIDMRAGHSWCHDLNKPFDADYSNAMKAATSYMVEKCGAVSGYCQSDESSLVFTDHTKLPFETRLFKLQSVFASMFTAAFIKARYNTKLWQKIENGKLPTFDCRVCNLPSLDEAVNMILWREKDGIKNSITLLALEHFSTKQIEHKNSEDKIKMLADINVDYFSLPEDLRNGTYFHRIVYDKVLTEDELNNIPEKNWPKANEDGIISVKRSKVEQFYLGKCLKDMNMEEKKKTLFGV